MHRKSTVHFLFGMGESIFSLVVLAIWFNIKEVPPKSTVKHPRDYGPNITNAHMQRRRWEWGVAMTQLRTGWITITTRKMQKSVPEVNCFHEIILTTFLVKTLRARY